MKTWASLFIAGWIALQLALPTSYYLGDGDPYDERFAWRMFSPVRMVKCSVALYSGGPDRRRDDLRAQELTMVWRGWMVRGRRSVAEAYLELRGERDRQAGHPRPWNSMDLLCRRPDGSSDQRLSRYDNRCDR